MCFISPILGGRYNFTSMGEPESANTITTADNSTMSNNSTATSTVDKSAVKIGKLNLLTQGLEGYSFQHALDSVILLFHKHLRFLLHNFNRCRSILFSLHNTITIRQCMCDRQIWAEGSEFIRVISLCISNNNLNVTQPLSAYLVKYHNLFPIFILSLINLQRYLMHMCSYVIFQLSLLASDRMRHWYS